MSEKAYKIYEEALHEQHSRNEARRIRTRVDEARRSPHSAAIRWPFELLQNALDAGPRDGRSVVTIRLCREPTKVIFEHDGASFTSDELAALLSGGSSKEFESATTTGRFGTGFLVTHVLAERTRLLGLLQLAGGCESFDLMLDRAGDEDAILANIRESHEAIRAAVPVPDPASMQSALLEYACSDGDVWVPGLEELRRALPYLYGTRKNLGPVELRTDEGNIEIWEPSNPEQIALDRGYGECRSITVTATDMPTRELRIYRFAIAADASAAALVLAEHDPQGPRVCLPGDGAPRVYREYPLRSSTFVPVNFVLDGKFDPEQERSGLLMSTNDKELLEQALSGAVLAVQYAIAQEWSDGHWLARAWCPSSAFHATDSEEKHWWTEHVADFAERLARLPIVKCGSQFLPAVIENGVDDGAYADFIFPRLLESAGPDETSVARLWPLVDATLELLPPRRELASDWTTIAEGWRSLGVPIEPISVVALAKWAVGDAQALDRLAVKGDAQHWLAVFVDIVGECWNNRSGTDLSPLADMMPNQNRRLCTLSALKRDRGVSERLKDICTGMGYDIRAQLLLSGFEEIAATLELRHLTRTLEEAIPRCVTEDEIILESVNYMSGKLPEDRGCDDVGLPLQRATVRLLAHLWQSGAKAAAATARQVPLVASSGRAVRWSADRGFMAPVRAWPSPAQPFADAYPPNRVLHDLYAGSDAEGLPNVAAALGVWGIAFADPLTAVTVELKDRRLQALCEDADTNGTVVSEQRLSQIALLQPEVLNRCQEGINEARALLGLVLCYVARRDPAWRERRVAKGRRSKEDVEVSIRGALWLADLKVRAWVPVPGEDDKPQKMVARAATLKHLLDPMWLQDNDDAISLLSEWFEFDRLDLRLMGIAQAEQDRQELRNSLAELVETGGANPEFYRALKTKVEMERQQKRDLERCRNMGLAVQEAIRGALESYRLEVTLVDRGFDYEVTLPGDDVFEDAASVFEIGPYLIEVKATKTGRPRLTATQAATAAQTPDRYVLCVVDLRQRSGGDPEQAWTPDRVGPLARLVPNIGSNVRETYGCVELARALEVSICNEAALRYEVPPTIWESGISISAWVEAVMPSFS